ALTNPNILGFTWKNLIYGFITGFMLTAASMVINDYYDREIDAINEPNRPIPSGLISTKGALAFAIVLTTMGFIAAYFTGILSFITAIIAWIIFIAYTTFGKRTGLFGNFLVSTCVAIPFIYGSIAVTNKVKLNVLIFVFMVFLSNTGREITKGIVDVQGDRMKNIKTLAVRYGEKTAAFVAVSFYISTILLSPLPLIL
ncbi:MAG: geranylgeranylglycerol-phosphate geranylgeranyltransferase, partial [Candidatus Bathyarchaeia archaeon]